MYKFRVKLALFMVVCLFFCSIPSIKAEAVEIGAAAGLTASTVFQICLFVGTVVLTYYVAGEIIDNREEIAKVGKDFIDSVTDIPEGWIMSMTDISGQDYVFGSEALQLVQDTPWEVIQGGAPDGGNNNGDDDNNSGDKKNLIDLAKEASQYIGNFTALGATWLYVHASNLYQKWVNGGELTEVEQAVLEPIIGKYCNQYDIAEQWRGDTYYYSMNINHSFVNTNNSYNYLFDLSVYANSVKPLAVYYHFDPDAAINSSHIFKVLSLSGDKAAGTKMFVSSSTISLNGASPTKYYYSDRSEFSFDIASNYSNFVLSYSMNFPVFSSLEAAENYLLTGQITDALNYARIYRNADWLAGNWQGQLIDPLANIGLTLSQLLELMKALSLNALGNNLSPEELADLIRESLPAVNPDLLPGQAPVIVPAPSPGTDPIYYPSPEAHPLPDPGPGNSDGGDGDNNTDPSDGDDTPEGKWAVDLSRFFPFCIPFDLVHLFSVLDAEPVAPRWEVPFKIEEYGIDYTFVIDLSVFNDVAEIFRLGETLLFILGLIMSTRNLIRG